MILPQYLLRNQGYSIEDFTDLTDWIVNAGSAASNTTEYREGGQSIKVTSGVGSNGIITKTLASSITFDSQQHMRINFYVHDVDTLSIIRYYFFTSGLATYIGTTLNVNVNIPPIKNGWNTVDIYPDQVTGGADWGDIFTDIRFRVEPVAGQQTAVTFDSLRTGLEGVSGVMWCFDDYLPSVYTNAYTYMNERQLGASYYIRTDQVNVGGNITSTQLLEMEGGGWSICNHTRSHEYGLSYEESKQDILDGKSDLEGWGLSNAVNHFAYPGGTYSDDLINAAIDAGTMTARVTTKGYPALDSYQDQVFLIPLTHAASQNPSWTDLIDDAITYKRVVVFFTHTVGNGGEITTSDFQEVVDYANNNFVPFLTINDLYNSLSDTPVPEITSIPTSKPFINTGLDLMPASNMYDAWANPLAIRLWQSSSVYKKFSKLIRNI